MDSTANYNLEKPAGSDYADVAVLNRNADKIDEALKKLEDEKAPSSHAHTQSDVSGLANALAGKAPSAHTHAQSEIEGLEAALSGISAAGHKHSASDITSGTLSSARLPTIPISKGGTGATSAANARSNLGITPENIGAASASHASDATKHITDAERTEWNGKAAGAHASQHASGGTDPITPASIGAAPSGFGLGGQSKIITNCDDAIYNGWYQWGISCENSPFDYGCMLAIVRNANSVEQIAFEQKDAARIKFRVKYSSSGFSDWFDIYSSKNPSFTYGTTDLTAGSSPLATGTMYLCYE